MKRYLMEVLAVASFFVFSLSSTGHAEDCNALLTHGLRNIRVSKSSEASLAVKYNQFCRQNYENLSDAVKGNIDVDIIGIGGGSASLSVDKKREILNNWCGENKEMAEANKGVVEEVQEIYKDALVAWNQCNQLKSQNVLMEPKITPDSKTVDISLRYNGPTSSGVLYMGYEANGFTCKDFYPTADGAKPIPKKKAVYIDKQAIKVHCDRAKAVVTKQDGTTFAHLQSGVVTIKTAGEDMQLFFAEEWTPSLPDQQATLIKANLEELKKELIPPGTIISFAGTMGDAEAQKKQGWWVCDGRTINDPLSKSYNGKPTPNLSGKFLLASSHAGDIGGSGSFTIPDQTIESRTYSFDGNNPIHMDPRVNVCGGLTWCTGASHSSKGNYKGISVPTIPPYYSVLYLMKVR